MSPRGDADMADTIAEVLKKWDSPYSVEQAIETHTKIVAMNPESIEVVHALRKSGVPAYLATNQHEYRARYMSQVFGYANIFDGEFYSCRLGTKKPEPGLLPCRAKVAALCAGEPSVYR